MGLTKHQAELRARVLTDARWLIAHQLIEGYSEARPYARPKYPPTRYFTNDCSGTLKLLFEWAGIPSPDGQPWGYGNTATLANADHAYHVPLDRDKWQPMDFCFYTRHPSSAWIGGPGEHVTMLTDRDKYGVWWCISHGGSSGPTRRRADYRQVVAVRRYRIPRR